MYLEDGDLYDPVTGDLYPCRLQIEDDERACEM